MRLRHGKLDPTEGPPADVGCRLDPRDLVHAVGTAGQRRREHHLARDDPGQPATPLFRVTEPCQRQRAEHQRGPQRHRGDDVSLRLQKETELRQPIARSSLLLGHCQPEEVGLGQRTPQGAVDGILGLLCRDDSIGVDQPGEKTGGGVGDCLLHVGEGEIHQAAPSSSGRAATNTGSESSSSKSTKVARRGWPICSSPGANPSMLATTRVPSSNSTNPIGSG